MIDKDGVCNSEETARELEELVDTLSWFARGLYNHKKINGLPM